MAAFVDIEPNGVETWVDGDESNRLQVHYRQDVEPILERAKLIRNEGWADVKVNGRPKNFLRLYCTIPPVTIMELRNKYGVNFFNRNHLKRAMYLIDTEYPYLKTTNMRHTVAE